VARVTADRAATRRAQIEGLELRGAPARVIARAVGADIRTVRRDLRAIAVERAHAIELAAERHRLLEAAHLVEREAWQLLAALPADDTNGRLGCLGKVLAAQARAAELVGALADAQLEERLSALEERLADMTPPKGPTRWAA
jgi:hypothetical protein